MAKVFVMMNTNVQLNMTAIADATPFTSDAKSSPIIIHGIGLEETRIKINLK